MIGFRSLAQLAIALVFINNNVGDAAEPAHAKIKKNLRGHHHGAKIKNHRRLDGSGKPTFKAKLSPEGTSTASGVAKFWVNEDETELKFRFYVENSVGILGKAGAHLHCAPLGSNGGVVAFLAGAVTGGFDGFYVMKATLTDANVNAGSTTCGDDIPSLISSIRDGNVYVNIHSTNNPSGDVRGQIA
mmetsp:Transcript_33027/g.56140  ORF Transcript_33027/g.56140 Transcript_33027/m.56140 type:complete len:187 (+) Transcript_33027:222-782(+)|eukprot:CAMPEP_0183758762 /NCGR_PEP_ID=MMETSP0739-20130205/6628_1 /TAXON_ID=385413 /ORGANISM="Thalassiosira miniscula, Strain CCMP1093" /LENGTH=186 /DNA_ID=CAMNT_0025996421 /DNA_START=178 /DNA_END=738 /DNA_ORIENTATION=+